MKREREREREREGRALTIGIGHTSSVESGDEIEFKGSVIGIHEDGTPEFIHGTTLDYDITVPGVSKGQAKTDSGGYYSITITIPEDTPEKDYVFTLTAKKEGYEDGSKETTFTVKKPTRA